MVLYAIYSNCNKKEIEELKLPDTIVKPMTPPLDSLPKNDDETKEENADKERVKNNMDASNQV